LDVPVVIMTEAFVTNAKEATGYRTFTVFLVLITVKPVLITSHVSRASQGSTTLTFQRNVKTFVRLIALYWDVLVVQVTVTDVPRAGMVQNVLSRAIFAEMNCATFESAQTDVKMAIIKTFMMVTITVDPV
jgi:uncharacterized membrane protein